MEEKPDYTIAEAFMEAMADESWEPDKEKREAAVNGLMFSVMFF